LVVILWQFFYILQRCMQLLGNTKRLFKTLRF
jgi:hypothetical protein